MKIIVTIINNTLILLLVFIAILGGFYFGVYLIGISKGKNLDLNKTIKAGNKFIYLIINTLKERK